MVLDMDTVRPLDAEFIRDAPGGEIRVTKGAQGVEFVLVNGEVLVERGAHTGAYPGRLIRGTDYCGPGVR